MDNGLEFGYWPMQARCGHLRWMIAYLGLDVKEAKIMSPQDWGQIKAALSEKNPFINLPYFKDGWRVYSETSAVADAIALKAARPDLRGKGQKDALLVTTIRSVNVDLRTTLLGNYKRTKADMQAKIDEEYQKKVFPKLQALEAQLGGKDYLVGYLTIADFEIAAIGELFAFESQFVGNQNPMLGYKGLMALCNRVKNLNGVKAVVDKWPVSNPQMVAYCK